MRINNIIKHKILPKTRQSSPRKAHILSTCQRVNIIPLTIKENNFMVTTIIQFYNLLQDTEVFFFSTVHITFHHNTTILWAKIFVPFFCVESITICQISNKASHSLDSALCQKLGAHDLLSHQVNSTTG